MKAMADHERSQVALYANMERLRAERLKREVAGDAPVAKPRRAAKRVASARR